MVLALGETAHLLHKTGRASIMSDPDSLRSTAFWLLPASVPVSLTLDSITLNKERFGDVAHVRFSLNSGTSSPAAPVCRLPLTRHSDLRPLFNWNTKMLFLCTIHLPLL